MNDSNELTDLLYHGQGTLKYSNGVYFKGNWYKNKFISGKVKKEESEFIYEGDWENGKYNGQGVLTHENGDVYKGGFSNS